MLAGVAAALALGAVSAGGSHPDDGAPRPLDRAHDLSPAQNRRPLDAQELADLERWAGRFATCMSDRGLGLGPPRAGADEIIIDTPDEAAGDPLALAPEMTACIKSLGGPPPAASVVLMRGGGTVEVFLPKTCPLPKRPAA
jgi:hypothetical protein